MEGPISSDNPAEVPVPERNQADSDRRYGAAWMRLRNARTAAAVALAAWLPLHAVLFMSGIGGESLFVTMPVFAGTLWCSAVIIGTTRCPRCGEYFARHPETGRRLLTTRCLNCGLEQWSSATRDSLSSDQAR